MLPILLCFSLDVPSLAKPLVDGGEVHGLSIGIVGPKGSETFLFGEAKPDELYEIGSITKTFTGVLLADLVASKVVSLDDPIDKWVKAPSFEGKKITLRHLATHTSGLPRMPANFHPKDEANPYVDYTAEQMYAFLASAKLEREPGSVYAYSNFGAGLLGQLIATIAKKPYEVLVKEKITGPLGMKKTSVALKGADRSGLATPRNESGAAVSPWEQDALQAAGAIRSNVTDMLAYLAANMDAKSPLAQAYALARTPHHDSDGPGSVGLGWHVRDLGRVVWHNGGTGGFHSYAAFDPVSRCGVVLLANTADAPIDWLGYLLLRKLSGEPAPPPRVAKPEKKLTTAQLDRLVGVYELAPTFAITVRREGDHLEAQATGQGSARLYAKSETSFYYRVVKAEIDFVPGKDGAIEALVLHQNGVDQRAKKR